jgi:hypothetical protein
MRRNLFQKFGARFELAQFYPSYERNLNAVIADFMVPGNKWTLVGDANFVAICYWCEGSDLEAKTYASKCVQHALDYFFGKWRGEILTDLKTIDPAWWRIHATWATTLSEAWCWASSVSDWKSVRRLADYPTAQSKPGVDATREEAAMYLALASFLRNEANDEYEQCFNTIQEGGNQKAKLVAEVIRGLQTKDKDKFHGALEAYLHYFRKREFKRTKLSKLLCLDGTTLLNIGKRDGFDFKVPPEVEDHIIRF